MRWKAGEIGSIKTVNYWQRIYNIDVIYPNCTEIPKLFWAKQTKPIIQICVCSVLFYLKELKTSIKEFTIIQILCFIQSRVMFLNIQQSQSFLDGKQEKVKNNKETASATNIPGGAIQRIWENCHKELEETEYFHLFLNSLPQNFRILWVFLNFYRC